MKLPSPELQERLKREFVPQVFVGEHDRGKIKNLLTVGVSREWITHHLKCSRQLVDRVTLKWKQEKLPKILQERATL